MQNEGATRLFQNVAEILNPFCPDPSIQKLVLSYCCCLQPFFAHTQLDRRDEPWSLMLHNSAWNCAVTNKNQILVAHPPGTTDCKVVRTLFPLMWDEFPCAPDFEFVTCWCMHAKTKAPVCVVINSDTNNLLAFITWINRLDSHNKNNRNNKNNPTSRTRYAATFLLPPTLKDDETLALHFVDSTNYHLTEALLRIRIRVVGIYQDVWTNLWRPHCKIVFPDNCVSDVERISVVETQFGHPPKNQKQIK